MNQRQYRTDNIAENLINGWQSTLSTLKNNYTTTANTWIDEFFITRSEQQLNDMLYTYVVKNVGMILDLRLELFDGFLRLYCTANFLGMHLSVFSDFRLTQIRLDRHVQRVTFEQIGDTTIMDLHTKSWYKAPLIRTAIKLYRHFLKTDPLPFLLSLSPKLKGKPFVEYKGNFIYLEIGRWFSDDIKNYLKKVQINHGEIHHEQLILRAQPNFSDILSFGNPDEVITEKDNPDKSSQKNKS